MHIRPQLSRRRTCDRSILRAEHLQDLNIGQESVSEGDAIERDLQKLEEMMRSIQDNDRLSEQDREQLLDPLKKTFDALHSSYEQQVECVLTNVTDSMQERIVEMQNACRERDKAVVDAENTMWETSSVNKEKIVSAATDVAQEHRLLLEQSQKDLDVLRQTAEQQRNAIRKHRK